MRCHYCSEGADVVVDSDGVQVGLCGQHLRERVEELAESGRLSALEDRLDVDVE